MTDTTPTPHPPETVGAERPGVQVRRLNERIVLSLIKAHGELSGAEIARHAGVSAQTASVIIRALEADAMLLRGTPRRGKIGKPQVPVSLDPNGALAFGARLGRRGAELVLMNLTGRVLARHRARYQYPTPGQITAFLRSASAAQSAGLTPNMRDRIVGIGIAAPFQLSNWLDAVGAPPQDMAAWRDFDFARACADFTDLPVQVFNDGTMACNGQLEFGAGRGLTDFACFHVGSFVGGGLVLGGRVFFGRTGNAGALGSLPLGDISRPDHQLIHHASIHLLERALSKAEGTPVSLWGETAMWHSHPDLLDGWIADTAAALARGAVATCAVVDVQDVVLDGGFPADVRARLCAATAQALDRIDIQGIHPPRILEGSLGAAAGALGAAYQPILAAHFLDDARSTAATAG
jgi:predicted NBD/HSP70 family sugar kinase